MQKWNWETKEYEPYEVPKDWYCPLYMDNMMGIINCACCGQKMIFGIGYTSREIHSEMGFGYIVCEDCYRKEFEREREAEKRGDID